MNILFYVALAFTILMMFIYWYANYSTKGGFAIDENKNNIPDKWEKFKIIFKLKSFILILLGFLLGYLFHFVQL